MLKIAARNVCETHPVTTIGASPPDAGITVDSGFVRGSLFFVTFLLIWLSLAPFRDLSDPALLDPAGAGDVLNQISVVLLTAALAAFVVLSKSWNALRAVTPLLALTLAWFMLSAIFADYPELAGRRLLLAVFTIFNAIALLTLPRDARHFAWLLAGAAGVLLVAAYVSVLVIPERAIHQSTDLLGDDLIGAWRGPFGHKNGAGAGMVIFIFIGIFVSRTVSRPVGAVLAMLAGIFLAFTHAKTSIILLPVILVMSFVLPRIHSRGIRVVAVIAAPIIINVLTIGSVCLDPIHNLLNALLPDPTFTNRDEIWRFTFEQIAQRPFFGFGFQAFWQTGQLMGSFPASEWVARASDAHNGLLNLAVMAGLPGALLSGLWILLRPATDYAYAPTSGSEPLTSLFLQIWLFGACLSGFESALFEGGNSVWFMMLVSMFGLRLQRITAPAR